MLFNSLEYGIFLVIAVVVYYRLPRGGQNAWLLLLSYVFYSFWDFRFLSLILFSTGVDYTVAIQIDKLKLNGDKRLKKKWLLLSLFSNLGLLATFKYFNFFIDSASILLESVGFTVNAAFLTIILPVGISFYTFQTLSYTIDVYRGRLGPTRSIIDFALFVAFFPQLVAGPIERASKFLPQLVKARRYLRENIVYGIYLIVVGLVRKVVIADTAAVLVDKIFDTPGSQTSLQLSMGLVLYSIQIYGDFSGYSNIARGSARLFGIELMRNFRHPYFAVNPADFWRRWHISLSTWLRDYLYIPLGGNQKGLRRTYINLMLTMTLGGLWHGASWNFVVWGLLHGLFLIIHKAFVLLRDNYYSTRPNLAAIERSVVWSSAKKIFASSLMFVLVTFTWLFFRSPDSAVTIDYLIGLSAMTGGGLTTVAAALILSSIVLLIDVNQATEDDEYFLLTRNPITIGMWLGIAIIAILLSGNTGEAFIYFQF